MNARIIIPTSQRLEYVSRLLASLLKNSEETTEPPSIVLLDDTQDVAAVNSLSGYLKEQFGNHNCLFSIMGKENSRKYFAQSNTFLTGLMEFSFCSHLREKGAGFVGGNRNFGLLLTTGNRVWSIDDDVLLNPVIFRAQNIHTMEDSAIIHPPMMAFGSEKRLRSTLDVDSADFLSIISSPTGYSFFDKICSIEQKAPKIVMTGLLGGRWYSSPHAYLTVPPEWQKKVWPNRGDYEVAKRSPYALLLAPELLYTESPFFVSACFGYDASEILPPFFPGIRASDALWGWIVRRMYPQSPICHLPIAIEHDRTLKKAFTDEDFKRIVPNSSEILLVLLNYLSADMPVLQPVDVLSSIGERLLWVHSLSMKDLRDLLCELYIQSLARRIGEFRQRLEESGGRPRFWARDVRDHIDLLRKEAATGEPWRPAEFRSDRDIIESERDFGNYIGRCGELLCAWPEIWERAAALKASGEFPL